MNTATPNPARPRTAPRAAGAAIPPRARPVRAWLGLLLGGTLAAAAAAQAQEPTRLDQILQDREAVLAQIVRACTQLRQSGQGSEEQVRTATVNLYVFRRETAKTPADRQQWQERIVAAEKEGQAAAQAAVKTGLATPMDVLLATERVLAAEQRLWELRLAK